MPMSKLSRRSLVTSAAELPALAVPAVAVASAGADLIFAALAAHRRLRAEWLSGVEHEYDLQVELLFKSRDPRYFNRASNSGRVGQNA